jgi:hypothetical protein
MEQIDYDLLFRWFVGLSMDDRVRDASTFSRNRDRLHRVLGVKPALQFERRDHNGPDKAGQRGHDLARLGDALP